MLRIDGARGEGGGQVLRSSLGLALVSRRAVRIERIRARRRRPGLMRQHLAAVRAAEAISGARVEGAELGSQELFFEPGAVRSGEYTFSIGTAGSTGLVLQTILPALALAPGESVVHLRGGTHNPHAPPFDYLARAFLPLLERMGPSVDPRLDEPGFYPAGGGRVTYAIRPCQKLRPLELLERGAIQRLDVVATVVSLPRHIAEREIRTALRALRLSPERGEVRDLGARRGPGNIVTIDVVSDALTEVFSGFGEKGVRAEEVAGSVAREARAYLEAGAPVGPYLADQLLLWLALAGGGRFHTVQPTEHTRTQAEVIRSFLDIEARCEQLSERVWEVAVSP